MAYFQKAHPVTMNGIYATCNHILLTAGTGTNGGYYEVWRGPATGAAYIMYLNGTSFWSGTTAVNGQPYFAWREGTGAASATGGSAKTIHKQDTRMGNSALVDQRWSSGTTALTTAGITPSAVPWVIIGTPQANGSVNPVELWFANDPRLAGWRIGPDEHWMQSLGAPSTAGSGMSGFTIWGEGNN